MSIAQKLVNDYFSSFAAYWDLLYSEPGLEGFIYQQRREIALRWVHDLQLPAGSQIADIGCGAGCTAVPLAGVGFQVTAVDTVDDMLRRTQQKALTAGVNARIETVTADAHALPLPTATCDVVVALGLLPWLNSPQRALAEFVRVLKPGGHLLVSSDNPARLNFVLDPVENPLVVPVRRKITRQLRRMGWMREKPGVAVHMFSPSQFQRLIRGSGIDIVRTTTVGFGPFTFFRKQLLNERYGIQLAARLQRLADRGFPFLSGSGCHCLILARKP